MAKYSEFSERLGHLLFEFAPARKAVHPEYPFWRLANDGLWELELPGPPGVRESLGDNPSEYMLRDREVSGGFPADIQSELESSPGLVRRAVAFLLEEYFPDTVHEEILSGAGVDLGRELVLRTRRDPAFRRRVLLAYNFRCALCGFGLQLDRAPIGLDAAHIRWKQANGPDDEQNGLALCSLHHRLFDRGAFTVDGERRALVSRRVMGTGLEPWLVTHHGQEIQRPREDPMVPAQEHLAWHFSEVFRAPSRE